MADLVWTLRLLCNDVEAHRVFVDIPLGARPYRVDASVSYNVPFASEGRSPFYGIDRSVLLPVSFIPWQSVEAIAAYVRSLSPEYEAVADAILQGFVESKPSKEEAR